METIDKVIAIIEASGRLRGQDALLALRRDGFTGKAVIIVRQSRHDDVPWLSSIAIEAGKPYILHVKQDFRLLFFLVIFWRFVYLFCH